MRIRDALVLVVVLGGGVATACSRDAAGPGDGPRTTLTGQGDTAHTGAPPDGTAPTPPPPPPDTLAPTNPPYTGQVRIFGRVIGATFIRSAPAGSDTVRLEPLAGVTVRAESGQDGTVVAETKTGSAGDYAFASLPAGAYTIRAFAPAGSGYADASRSVQAASAEVRVDLNLWRNQ